MEHTVFWPGWETVRLIGRGSFGAVYEIQRKLFGEVERAALKVITIPQNASEIEELRSDGFDEESITNTFRNHLKSIVSEYSIMRKMNGSANIVNCDDVRYVQHEDGIGWDIYIKMELLTPLTKALPDAIPEELVIKIAEDLCAALELCERFDIVHRDIKPQNIFVSDIGDYKLGDFGVAKTVEKTMGGTKIGTYKYMAPEVYNNQPYGSAADIYSLGLVLYWMLNERRMPFLPLPPAKLSAGMDEAARTRRLKGEPLPAPKHGSEELKRIVLKACAYETKDRYKDAMQMKASLDLLSVPSGKLKEDVSVSESDTEVKWQTPDAHAIEAAAELDETVVEPAKGKTSELPRQKAEAVAWSASGMQRPFLIAAVCALIGIIIFGSVFFLWNKKDRVEPPAGPVIEKPAESTAEVITEAPTEEKAKEVTTEATTEATTKAAPAAIPVKIVATKSATIEAYDYVEGDASTLENTAEAVTVGNKLAIKVTPAEGYELVRVRVNNVTVETCEDGYWMVDVTEGTNTLRIKALTQPVTTEAATEASTETTTEATTEAAPATIPVSIIANKNAAIEAFDYVEGNSSTLKNPAEAVTIGNKLAIRVTPAEGYELVCVFVNNANVETFKDGYWIADVPEGTNNLSIKVLTQAVTTKAAPATIPVVIVATKSAAIEAYDYVEGDASTLENTVEAVTVGNKLAVKVIPAEGYELLRVRVNNVTVETCEDGYWMVDVTEGTNTLRIKALTQPVTVEAATEETKAETEPPTTEPAPTQHQHTYAADWSVNEAYHWHTAICGHSNEMSSFGEHVWNDGVVITRSSHTATGEMAYSCAICGARKIEVIPADVDAHVFDQQVTTEQYLAAPATPSSPALYYESCICGEKGTRLFFYGEAVENETTSHAESAESTQVAPEEETPAWKYALEAATSFAPGNTHIVGVQKDGSTVAIAALGTNGLYNECKVQNWSDIVAVAAGNSYTVGLKKDGRVVTTGRDQFGETKLSTWSNVEKIYAYENCTMAIKTDGTVLVAGDTLGGRQEASYWVDIVELSDGGPHVVGLKSDGTVVAAGSNYHNECNVSEWTDIVSVAAGAYHTVGLKSDGTVVAVGSNTYGQCGVDGWKDITAIAANDNYTFGVHADGTVSAVGQTAGKQCNVSGWTDIVAIRAGSKLTVGMKSNGMLVTAGGESTWNISGAESWRKIMLPDDRTVLMQAAPDEGLEPWEYALLASKSIATGYGHTVGLKTNGTVVAVGAENYYNQCSVNGWTDIVAVYAGRYNTFGLRSDGTLVAVGANDYGECDVSSWADIVDIAATHNYTLGLKSDGQIMFTGDAGNINDRNFPNVVRGWSRIIDIAAGYEHAVGLRTNGTVIAAGDNVDGKCNVDTWTGIVAIAASDYHTVGLREDGTVVAVGKSSGGQCAVSGWENIVAISAGVNHTVGLKADGTVVAVGANTSGQCNVRDWRNIVAISAGKDFTVGLKADGTMVAVGNKGESRCAVSDWTRIVVVKESSAGGFAEPHYAGDLNVDATFARAMEETIKHPHTIAAGFGFSLGVTEDGKVLSTGLNSYGQCNVGRWDNVVAVAAGSNHSVGLRADGTVLWAGSNDKNQCNVGNWTDIIDVAAGDNYTVALRVDGSVLATGENKYGQCMVGNWEDIVAIAVGTDHTVGLRKDGTVVATGNNEYSKCQVERWTNVVAIAVGKKHTIGLRDDGTILFTGNSSAGQYAVWDWHDIIAIAATDTMCIGMDPEGYLMTTDSADKVIRNLEDIVSFSSSNAHTLCLRKDGTVFATGTNGDKQCEVGNWTNISTKITP